MLNNNPQDAVEGLEAVSEGYARGKRAVNLLTHPVLERFADPLADVRRDLNIE